MSSSLQIANTIKQQIGHKALFMIGAKNLSYGQCENGNVYLTFKIMRNSKRVSYIKIIYVEGLDTYTMQFLDNKGKMIREVQDVYFDGLRNAIEINTGLYTSL